MIKLSLITVLLLNSFSFGWGQLFDDQGRISGIVSDISAARIPNAKISVIGNGVTQVFTTNEEGAYNIPLKPDTYTVTVTSTGFCPTSRPDFKIEKGSIGTFDFVMVVCPLVNKLIYEKGKYVGETCSYKPPYQEDRYPIKSSALRPRELLIRYGERIQGDGQVNYQGYKAEVSYSFNGKDQTDKKKLPVAILYDLLTIGADKVVYIERRNEFEAKGKVTVTDGNKRWEGDHLTLKLTNGKAEIQFLK